MEKEPLIGKSLDELRQLAKTMGMPAFAGGQMAEWLYRRHTTSIDEMTNISKAGRAHLSESHDMGLMPPSACQRSMDGTVKYLFPTSHGQHVETVYIPDGERATLCVSSQVGCKMRCRFCQTGRQGFQGNLTAGDILNQVLALPERDTLTNIVFMGQGEPMDNLDAVLKATEVLTAPWGLAWSPRRITVSSVGVKEKLQRFLDTSECHVAISLHTPFAHERAALMPAERAMPIAAVVELLRKYDFAHQRRLSFEYIVFEGVNDSLKHARETARLLNGLHCRVNLIRFHHIPDTNLQGAGEERIMQLRDYLTSHGIFTTIRASRGEDIQAACGLLSTANNNTSTT
ncbi:MAG: 23S rRNA (adenine(2503)-C(2))-methyltransferase RlmN [Prevotella sp.]|nr:23S rRNA (adenine(2503)-C(2))-methyltransferase RlmN [Prevotella sp.]